jgi:hypothetical protein
VTSYAVYRGKQTAERSRIRTISRADLDAVLAQCITPPLLDLVSQRFVRVLMDLDARRAKRLGLVMFQGIMGVPHEGQQLATPADLRDRPSQRGIASRKGWMQQMERNATDES